MQLSSSDPDIQTIVGRIVDGSLELQPEFQRGAVWSRPKQRLLIDSILRNWYVPPIHVVRTPDQRQEVLDGQQRLTAIYEFTQGRFTVDGTSEPFSEAIDALDGCHYDQLPNEVRRGFDRFPVRMFELTNYQAEEPYELFYRLNQPTTLTSAEKRNAFFGKARDQVKSLTERAQNRGMTASRIGFSNTRFAYEDVVARFVWTLDEGTLSEKVTAAVVTERYRLDKGFSRKICEWAGTALDATFGISCLERKDIRFNKASAHSWLCFVARAMKHCPDELDILDEFVEQVEENRAVGKQSNAKSKHGKQHDMLITILNDRSSARVSDISSVLLRDIVLWQLFYLYFNRLPFKQISAFVDAAKSATSPSGCESALLTGSKSRDWGRLV